MRMIACLGSCFDADGRHFCFTLLYVQVLRQTWPMFRRTIGEICAARLLPAMREANMVAQGVLQRLGAINEALQRARASGDEREASVLEAELADLQQEMLNMGGPAAATFLQAFEPDRLLTLARNIFDTLATAAGLATSNGARVVGVGVNIGDRVCETVEAALAPLLRRGLHSLRLRAPAIDAMCRDATGARWIELGVKSVCSAVGLSLAFRFEAAVFCAANALWGSDLMLASAAVAARACLPDSAVPAALRGARRGGSSSGSSSSSSSSHDDAVAMAWSGGGFGRVAAFGSRETSGQLGGTLVTMPRAMNALRWLLAGAGVYLQTVGSGRGPLPRHLRLVLFAPLLCEGWVRGSTFAVRGLSGGSGGTEGGAVVPCVD